MKIGIIGCGYVGRRIAQTWKDQGHIVTVTTRDKKRIKELSDCSSGVFLIGDIAKFVQDQDIILLSVAAKKGGDYESTYLKTAKHLVSCLHPSQRIIYTGSTSVYGDAKGNWVDEDTLVRPMNDHAKILIETEKELLKHKHCCIFRLGQIIGPGRELKDRLLQIQGGEIFGSGENFVNWIHIDDIIRALDLAKEKDLTGVFNLCNDEHVTRKNAYVKVCQQENIPVPKWNRKKNSFFGGNKRVSNKKIKALLEGMRNILS